MNVADRAAWCAEVHRVLAPAGPFATYDVLDRDRDVVYPVPWARDASISQPDGHRVVQDDPGRPWPANLARNIREQRLGVLSAVLIRGM